MTAQTAGPALTNNLTCANKRTSPCVRASVRSSVRGACGRDAPRMRQSGEPTVVTSEGRASGGYSDLVGGIFVEQHSKSSRDRRFHRSSGCSSRQSTEAFCCGPLAGAPPQSQGCWSRTGRKDRTTDRVPSRRFYGLFGRDCAFCGRVVDVTWDWAVSAPQAPPSRSTQGTAPQLHSD